MNTRNPIRLLQTPDPEWVLLSQESRLRAEETRLMHAEASFASKMDSEQVVISVKSQQEPRVFIVYPTK